MLRWPRALVPALRPARQGQLAAARSCTRARVSRATHPCTASTRGSAVVSRAVIGRAQTRASPGSHRCRTRHKVPGRSPTGAWSAPSAAGSTTPWADSIPSSSAHCSVTPARASPTRPTCCCSPRSPRRPKARPRWSRGGARARWTEAAAVMYSVTVLRACCGPGACAHRLRTDALASSRQCPHNAANPGTRDLLFRTIPAVADPFRQGSKDTANAVWVYSPPGVQIPEPPPLTWVPATLARAVKVCTEDHFPPDGPLMTPTVTSRSDLPDLEEYCEYAVAARGRDDHQSASYRRTGFGKARSWPSSGRFCRWSCAVV